MEDKILPVHSFVLEGSAILRACFSDSLNVGKPSIKTSFRKYTVHEVTAFLSQLYPMADPERTILRHNCCKIVDIAKYFGCESVIASVKSYLESAPVILTSGVDPLKPMDSVRWFSLAKTLCSKTLDSALVQHLIGNFETLMESITDDQIEDLFSHLSGAIGMKVAKARDKIFRGKIYVGICPKNKCSSCSAACFGLQSNYVLDFGPGEKVSSWLHCRNCNSDHSLDYSTVKPQK